jgi:hypothetical protein
MIKTKMYTYWILRLLEELQELQEAKLYKSLKFMDNHLTFGKVHPLAKSTTYNIRDIAGADPGFQVRGGGGALKKMAPSGGRRENIGGISCEKSRFYAPASQEYPYVLKL